MSDSCLKCLFPLVAKITVYSTLVLKPLDLLCQDFFTTELNYNQTISK